MKRRYVRGRRLGRGVASFEVARPAKRPLWTPLRALSVVSAVIVAGVAVFAMSYGNAATTINPNCTLIVPANPTTAAGLATPYQLTATNPRAGACHEANADQSAYVQGAIISPAGQITLYDPLVVDRGTRPAAAPAAATVPAGSTVAVWFGFNGTNLTLAGPGAAGCVNGSRGSIFGQFAYCNAAAFFQAANAAIGAGTLKVPAVGTAKDGLPCPTVRDFSMVDQDQSDNVTTHYLANARGRTAQANAAGRAALGNGATDLFNGSDNRLLDAFIDPALGCTPWTAPDGAADNQPATSLPLNELQAAANQKAPVALVPANDPMTQVNGASNTAKTTLYRAGVDQAAASAANDSGATYCRDLFNNPAGIQRVFKDQALFSAAPSVDPGAATNLFTFLAMRANQSFANLNCGALLNEANPVNLAMDNNGVVTAAAFGAPAPGGPGASASATAAPPTTRRARPPRHHIHM